VVRLALAFDCCDFLISRLAILALICGGLVGRVRATFGLPLKVGPCDVDALLDHISRD
jgi:hypothetical protein